MSRYILETVQDSDVVTVDSVVITKRYVEITESRHILCVTLSFYYKCFMQLLNKTET